MQFKTAIAWLHGLVTLALLVAVIMLVCLNAPPAPAAGDTLQGTYPLSDSVWLYRTENGGGGATVPTTYRYYLAGEFRGEASDILRQLHNTAPFLEGTGSITAAKIGINSEVRITYSGKIMSLQGDISDAQFTIRP